jgi:hypothetical protein
MGKAPAVEALAVEQRHWLAELDLAQVGHGGIGGRRWPVNSARSSPLPSALGMTLMSLSELRSRFTVMVSVSFTLVAWPFGFFAVNTMNALEHKFLAVQRGSVQFEDTAPVSKHLGVEALATRFDAKPAGVSARNGQCPSALELIFVAVASQGMDHIEQAEQKYRKQAK